MIHILLMGLFWSIYHVNLVLQASGQAGPADNCFEALSSERPYGQRIIFFFGDSISRGYGLSQFPDLFSRDQQASQPLWIFRSPYSVINGWLTPPREHLRDSCVDLRKRDLLAVYGGAIGLPYPELARTQVRRIERLYKIGTCLCT